MKPVLYSLDSEGIAWIVLNRPEKLNALNREVWTSLHNSLRDACNDEGVRAVALTGSGRAFSAGDDIYDMYNLRDIEDSLGFFTAVMDALKAMINCGKPLMTLVNGLAYGGGGEILLLTDYNVALREAVIAYPEALIGLFPPVLLTYGKYIVGPRRALQLAYTGKPLTADDAFRLGIVDELVDTVEEGKKRITEAVKGFTADARMARRFIPGSQVLTELEEAIRLLALKTVEPGAKRLMEKWMRQRRGEH